MHLPDMIPAAGDNLKLNFDRVFAVICQTHGTDCNIGMTHGFIILRDRLDCGRFIRQRERLVQREYSHIFHCIQIGGIHTGKFHAGNNIGFTFRDFEGNIRIFRIIGQRGDGHRFHLYIQEPVFLVTIPETGFVIQKFAAVQKTDIQVFSQKRDGPHPGVTVGNSVLQFAFAYRTDTFKTDVVNPDFQIFLDGNDHIHFAIGRGIEFPGHLSFVITVFFVKFADRRHGFPEFFFIQRGTFGNRGNFTDGGIFQFFVTGNGKFPDGGFEFDGVNNVHITICPLDGTGRNIRKNPRLVQAFDVCIQQFCIKMHPFPQLGIMFQKGFLNRTFPFLIELNFSNILGENRNRSLQAETGQGCNTQLFHSKHLSSPDNRCTKLWI